MTAERFHNDLADYLEAGETDIAREQFERMQDRYPWDVREGSVEFFPSYRGGGYLVDPPERPEVLSAEMEDTGFEEYLAEYLLLESEGEGVEALEVLGEMRERYESQWLDDDKYIMFFPEGYVSTKVSIPSLSSMASSFNEMGPEDDELEIMREFLDRNYYRTGSLSVSIYTHGDDGYILDEDSGPGTELISFDHLAEEYPLEDLVEEVMEAGERASSELMDLVWEYFYTGDAEFEDLNGDYSVFHDPLDETVVVWRIGETDPEVEGEEVLEKLQARDNGRLYNDIETSDEETVFERLFNPETFDREGTDI